MSFQSYIGKKGVHGEVIAVSPVSWPLTPESIENEVWLAQIEIYLLNFINSTCKHFHLCGMHVLFYMCRSK